MSFPKPHSNPPVFMKAVTEHGGSFGVEIKEGDLTLEALKRNRRYDGGLVAVTETEFSGVDLVTTDYMPIANTGELLELLVRKVEVVNTTTKPQLLTVQPVVKPNPDVDFHNHGVRYQNGMSTFVVNNSFPHARSNGNSYPFWLGPGESKTGYITIDFGTTQNPSRPIELEGLLNNTRQYWSNLLGHVQPELTIPAYGLLGLIDRETGAPLAAATAGIESVPGGEIPEKWDYRYAWIRDAAYTVDGLLEMDMHDEVKKVLEFFLQNQSADGRWNPMYAFDGSKPPHEQRSVVDPSIRYGNNANDQRQLDAEAHIILSIEKYVAASKDIDFITQNKDRIIKAANASLEDIAKRDNGIWEARGVDEVQDTHELNAFYMFGDGKDLFTYSKTMQFAGLQSALRMADQLGVDRSTQRFWQQGAWQLRKSIRDQAWSNVKESYVQRFVNDEEGNQRYMAHNDEMYFVPHDVDISVLAMAQHGVVDINDEQWIATENKLYDTLVHNGGVKRYENAPVSFFPASFSFAAFLFGVATQEGPTRRGYEAFNRGKEILDRSSNTSTTGLYSESHRNKNGVDAIHAGNTPQLWSLTSKIVADRMYERAEKKLAQPHAEYTIQI